MRPPYRVWIDRGGTFTDVIVHDRRGALRVTKVLSADDAVETALRKLLRIPPGRPLPPLDVRMGTTVATNALLERRGAPVALLTQSGLTDLLRLDDQRRPELFDLRARRPPPLTDIVLPVQGRCGPNAEPIEALDEQATRSLLRHLKAQGVRSIAVALLHAHRHPALEQRVAAWARQEGLAVTCSHEVSAEEGLLARAQTALVDAYVTPVLRRRLASLEATLEGSPLRMMQSSGDLIVSERFRGRDALVSGPAGGAVASARLAKAQGVRPVIGFDMGGTSTDVSRWDGEHERRAEATVAGLRVRAPMIAIHTVAAGGGSICRFDGHRLTVGPESAGADPGPLCYGRGGQEPTLTDAAVVLGRLPGERFALPLHEGRSRAGLECLGAAAGLSAEACAEGLVQIAVTQMAAAIAEITVAQGHDARDHTLIVFGGAGGQYACKVAKELGIRRCLSHPWAGVLSAWGIGMADEGWHVERALSQPLERSGASLHTAARDLAEGSGDLEVRFFASLRHPRSEASIEVPWEPGLDHEALRAKFDAAFLRRFGYLRRDEPVEVTRLRAHLRRPADVVNPPPARCHGGAPRPHRIFAEGAWVEAPLWSREDLPIDRPLTGPLVVVEATGTLVVDSGWTLRRAPDDVLWMEAAAEARRPPSGVPDPVRLEVMGQHFASIGERMGAVLRRTALSTNIRDRHDFSCAVFDREGNLIANAPHIPVHLGAMGASVRALRDQARPGVVYATNDPSAGGSHLPDITVVAPVHDQSGTLRAFVAARGHHADVGGLTPGSMPAFSSRLDEEGVVLGGIPIVDGGALREGAVREAFTSAPYPARYPAQNLADLEAQVAACTLGRRLLEELAGRFGWPTVEETMDSLLSLGEALVREAVGKLPPGPMGFEDTLDDGTLLRVRLTREAEGLHVDFTGTAPAHPENFNAPRAITRACVLYVVRCLVRRPIPLNEGCLRALRLTIPQGSLLDPPAGAAVAAGNVETSQRVVDVLFGALGLVAASQGTMNNLSLGDTRFGYYETIAGGAGAGPGFDGASGVHTHMTNSSITDPEVLETRYPVRLRHFGLRRGSGGAGRWTGGDGVIRSIEALASLELSLLSERRVRPPYGLAGGQPGKPGRNLLRRADGREEPLGGRARVTLGPGDVVVVETPGGGGYGAE